MIKKKTIEVWICDLCGREGYKCADCDKCKKELCSYCCEYFNIKIECYKPSEDSGFYHLSSDKKGYQVSLCKTDAAEIKKKVLELGFEEKVWKAIKPV